LAGFNDFTIKYKSSLVGFDRKGNMIAIFGNNSWEMEHHQQQEQTLINSNRSVMWPIPNIMKKERI